MQKSATGKKIIKLNFSLFGQDRQGARNLGFSKVKAWSSLSFGKNWARACEPESSIIPPNADQAMWKDKDADR